MSQEEYYICGICGLHVTPQIFNSGSHSHKKLADICAKLEKETGKDSLYWLNL